jgi:hypothetical protein
METKFFKNQAGEIKATSDQEEIVDLVSDKNWTEISEAEATAEVTAQRQREEEKAKEIAETLPPITDNLVAGVQYNAASGKTTRRLSYFGIAGLLIAVIALGMSYFALTGSKYDDTALTAKIDAVETEANNSITEAANAASNAIAKLRRDASDEFNANRGARAKLAERLDAAESSVTKLKKSLKGKASWVSLKKVENTAAAERAALKIAVDKNGKVADDAFTKASLARYAAAANANRLDIAEANLAAQKKAILDVANRADTFIQSAKVTRKWFLGKPSLEAERGVFNTPIFSAEEVITAEE